MVTFACSIGITLWFLAQKISSFVKTLIKTFFSQTQENANLGVQKLQYFFTTQKNSSWQVHYPTLPKLGRKEKPGLKIKQCNSSF